MPTHKLSPMEAAERKARIVELRRQRRQWDAIGAEFDISAQRAYQLYQQALTERPNLQVDEHRAEETELIDLAVRRLMAIAVDGSVSPRTKVEAWGTIRSWCERKAKLLGLDAPTVHQHLTMDAIDAEIAQLDGILASRASASAS